MSVTRYETYLISVPSDPRRVFAWATDCSDELASDLETTAKMPAERASSAAAPALFANIHINKGTCGMVDFKTRAASNGR